MFGFTVEIHPSLIPFAIAAAFTPGPNNIMIMASGLNFGWRASMPHFFGICFGFPSMFLAVGFGLGYLFERFELLHEFIQIAGILYLLYLAWRIANAAPTALDAEHASRPLSFIQAALFQWVNPKAWIMGTSAIAAYTTVGADLNLQILLVGFVFFLMTFPSAGVWMLFGAGLKKILSDPTHQKVFNVTMAIMLAASVAPIAWNLIAKYS
ncbi:MAG: threonine/homoserine/homoserine lactone efflux protein [Porticoccaceae bacterium]|jgi:threonine/homoserine/homoserine lactone efflux protein